MSVVLILGGSIVVSHCGFSLYFPGECWQMPLKSLVAICMVFHEGSKYFIYLFLSLLTYFHDAEVEIQPHTWRCWNRWVISPALVFFLAKSYVNLELTTHPKLVLDSLSFSLTSARIYYNCVLPCLALSSIVNRIDHLLSVNWNHSFCLQSLCLFFRCVTISSHHYLLSDVFLRFSYLFLRSMSVILHVWM